VVTDDTDTMSPGKAALLLGVNPRTIARWADDGMLGPVTITAGGHRRLDAVAVNTIAILRANSATNQGDHQ
jgi:excisionase family DNA binding protein